MRRIAVLVAGLALLAACCERTGERKDSRAPGAPPPPLAIAEWYGSEPLTLDGLKGKVVLLDFWNTFCGPCRKLIPHLEELHKKHKADGLAVIGITEDDKADLEAFLKKNPIAYPIALDRLKAGAGETFEAYKIVSIPTVCLIARDGSLAWRGQGHKLTDGMVLAELAKK